MSCTIVLPNIQTLLEHIDSRILQALTTSIIRRVCVLFGLSDSLVLQRYWGSVQTARTTCELLRGFFGAMCSPPFLAGLPPGQIELHPWQASQWLFECQTVLGPLKRPYDQVSLMGQGILPNDASKGYIFVFYSRGHVPAL